MQYPRAGVLILAPFVVGYYLSYLFRTINAVIADDEFLPGDAWRQCRAGCS